MSASTYYLDLDIFSLGKLKQLFETTRLLPSQQILQEEIEARFALLAQNGIQNLEQLQKALKTKAKVAAFAQETGLPVDYLTVLRREVNSYQPKPVKLSDFPGVDPDVVRRLEEAGIKNTKQLFEHVQTSAEREQFAAEYQIDPDDLFELTKLTDVARLKWVGPKFARLLVDSEYDTVAKVAASDPAALYADLVRTNEERGIYKGKFGINDLESWVTVAVQDVPQVIQY